MPRGSKASYTSKQKRMAAHIEEGEKKTHSAKRAKAIAWATVNKETHGGKKSGSGRGKKSNTASSKRGGKLSHATPAKAKTKTSAKPKARSKPRAAAKAKR
jgi:hypothetical protein